MFYARNSKPQRWIDTRKAWTFFSSPFNHLSQQVRNGYEWFNFGEHYVLSFGSEQNRKGPEECECLCFNFWPAEQQTIQLSKCHSHEIRKQLNSTFLRQLPVWSAFSTQSIVAVLNLKRIEKIAIRCRLEEWCSRSVWITPFALSVMNGNQCHTYARTTQWTTINAMPILLLYSLDREPRREFFCWNRIQHFDAPYSRFYSMNRPTVAVLSGPRQIRIHAREPFEFTRITIHQAVEHFIHLSRHGVVRLDFALCCCWAW